MVREVVTINIGECGVQLGHNVWRQYCTEHNINKKGIIADNSKDYSFLCFFEEQNSGEFIPRNLMVDTEPDIIDDIKTSEYAAIFDGEYLLNGKQDAANNFARGHYKIGPDIIDKVNDGLRKLVDNSDNVQGFVINHSVGGGTGSGLGALILQRIAIDFRKKSKIGFEIYPFNNHYQSNCVVEPYNALLSTHWLLDHTEISFLFDNRKLYNICKNNLEIEAPTYHDLNTLITKIESSTTCSLRNQRELNVHLNELIDICPFPRLHFITPSMAPIISNKDIEKVPISQRFNQILIDAFIRCNWSYPINDATSNINISLLQYEPPIYQDLLHLIYKSYTDNFQEYAKKYYVLDSIYDLHEMCVDSDYFMIECNDYDPLTDKNMSISVNSLGNVKSKEVNPAFQTLRANLSISFAECACYRLKLGLNEYCIPSIENDVIKCKEKMVTMCANNTFISRFFSKRISEKYDLMYSQKAFVHWYVINGMEQAEFEEAREDLQYLEKDYFDVLYEQATDDEEYHDDDY